MDAVDPKPDARLVLISRNPNSGATDQTALVERLSTALKKRGLDVEVFSDIAALTRRSADDRDHLRCVVAAGGDGTVSLLANQLAARTPLAIFPLGTENLLAKHVGSVAEPEQAADAIVQGDVIRLDAGRANGKLFLVMASCGFDAEVVRRLHANRRGHIQHWSYALPILRSIGRYRYPQIRMTIDGQEVEATARWAFIFNVPRYAMNLPIAFDAVPNDGSLDLCTFRGGNLFRGLFYLAAVLARQHRNWTRSRHYRFQRLRLESVGSDPIPFQLDGDPGGQLPLEIDVLPDYLRLIAPIRRVGR